jgi:hypothetical protein
MRKRVLENPITFRPRRCRFCGKLGARFVPELGKGYAHHECWKTYITAQHGTPGPDGLEKQGSNHE